MGQGVIDLSGKIALVTGGGAGIGLATCEAFAKAGATVVTIEKDMDRVSELKGILGSSHIIIHGDVTQSNDVSLAAKTIESAFGKLDILVNNVGDFLNIVKRFEDHSDEDIERLYATNLLQIFSTTRAMIPLLRKSANEGSIVSVSSIEGFRGIPINCVYSAFKTAIAGFTKSLALDLAVDGIRVNLIAPETTETAQVAISQFIKPGHEDAVKQWIPLGRFGTPEDMANAILFLSSPMASWITGTAINIDGGALAASGWYRTAEGKWTNAPIIPTDGLIF